MKKVFLAVNLKQLDPKIESIMIVKIINFLLIL